MQLNRKATGVWENARDFVGQDLDTIMRTINQQQQVITTLQTSLATVQAQLAASNLAITAAGQVNGIPSGRNLQTVAHDGTLLGLGTPASPLSAVSQAGSLIDFSTTLTVSDLSGIFATPMTVISGVTNAIIMPVYWCYMYTKNNQAWGTGQSLQCMWGSNTTSAAAMINALSLGVNDATVKTNFAEAAALSTSGSLGTLSFALGDPLKIRTSASLGAAGTFAFTAGLRLRIVYIVLAF